MYNNVNNTFSNRRRTNSLLILALIFVLSVFAVGCDSTAEEASAAGEVTADTAVIQETAVDTPVVEVSSQAAEMAAIELTDTAIIDTTNTVYNQNNNGNGNANANGADTDPEHIPAADLAAQMDIDISDEEADGLIFMREEEKLARDVYLTLYDVWGTAVFNNIASSEQVHMDAILMLMDQYGLADPAAGNDVGVFTDPALQSLYDQLVATGSGSLADALAVGAAIEEIDILDLDEYIAATTNPAISQVYSSLLTGSESHLRAFVPQLERESGETYNPQYMSQDQYDTIMSASTGNGQQGGGEGGYGQSSNGEGGNGQGGNSQGGNGKGSNGQGGNGYQGGSNGSNGKGGGNGQTQG